MSPPRILLRKRLQNRQFLSCLLTLVCFLTTAVRVPLEPVGTPRSGCQCDQGLQEANQCCCARAVKSGCCNVKTRSCCARKQSTSCCAGGTKQLPEESSETPEISSCGCGGSPVTGMLANYDPALLPVSAAISETPSPENDCPEVLLLISNHSALPETPPPEVYCL